jgi:hypothetical protein
MRKNIHKKKLKDPVYATALSKGYTELSPGIKVLTAKSLALDEVSPHVVWVDLAVCWQSLRKLQIRSQVSSKDYRTRTFWLISSAEPGQAKVTVMRHLNSKRWAISSLTK